MKHSENKINEDNYKLLEIELPFFCTQNKFRTAANEIFKTYSPKEWDITRMAYKKNCKNKVIIELRRKGTHGERPERQ